VLCIIGGCNVPWGLQTSGSGVAETTESPGSRALAVLDGDVGCGAGSMPGGDAAVCNSVFSCLLARLSAVDRTRQPPRELGRASEDPVIMVPPIVPHLIDGKDVPASDGATFDVFNPLTDEVLYRASAATLDDTNAAIETAHKAWKEWKTWGPSRRRQVLLKAADILESRKEEAMKLLSDEVSAMPAWAAVNVMGGAAILRESAALATHVKGEIVPADRPGMLQCCGCVYHVHLTEKVAGTTIMILREPAGVVLSIAPWNVRWRIVKLRLLFC
jgi:hypothetical protein